MPLSQPVAQFRQQLEAWIREDQLFDALNALLETLPHGTENHQIVSAFVARLNAANKERRLGTIAIEEHARLVAQVRADLFELIGGLKEADFNADTAAKPNAAIEKAVKQGVVLYRVPGVMKVRIPTRCTIRVAVDEEAILQNIVYDEHVELHAKVEISDVMSAELLDPENSTFQITALNARTQLVKDTGYTEWNFSVLPLREGVHQLLVKVSILEKVEGFADPIPRDVSLMETVTIITESAAPADRGGEGDFKPSGQTFAFHSSATAPGGFHAPSSKAAAAPPPIYAPTQSAPATTRSSTYNLRPLALFLAFLVLAPAATWAFTPPATRDWWVANFKGSTEAFAAYIEEYAKTGSPYLEKAYFRKAETSGQLADLRTYQQQFPQGKYRKMVVDKVYTLETKAIENIRQQPDSLKIRRFAADFPESERLSELKQVVETRSENRRELLAAVEEAYVVSIREEPTEAKVAAYLRDFPDQTRLEEVESAARANPQVFSRVQPVLEDAYLKKMENRPTEAQAEQYLQKFPDPVQRQKFEKILDKKPDLKKKAVDKIEKAKARRQETEAAPTPATGAVEPETKLPDNERPRRSGIHDMVRVEGGRFLMGSPEGEPGRFDSECQHEVRVASFSMGQYEVTQADWREIMGEDPPVLYNKGCDECPVESVSCNEVQQFIKKLNQKYPGKNYRLPTEAQWEYAARGGKKSKGYIFAGSNDLKKAGWYDDNYKSEETHGEKKTTHRVGEKAPNELELYDLSGNVSEWCEDTWLPYPNCDGLSGTNRVLRGGSWSGPGQYCRVACRGNRGPNHRLNFVGFRLALSLQ
ncbi:MAG: SUMF1/EgtB/PvdO family nonheme iron enzyme [Saprospiraceae bacterium]|nr:SUMF1/EgtB/PvdO family nonheme iron enzyme [Saprospiraceae bacterium]